MGGESLRRKGWIPQTHQPPTHTTHCSAALRKPWPLVPRWPLVSLLIASLFFFSPEIRPFHTLYFFLFFKSRIFQSLFLHSLCFNSNHFCKHLSSSNCVPGPGRGSENTAGMRQPCPFPTELSLAGQTRDPSGCGVPAPPCSPYHH